ncbi:MAG: sulfotransferase, partial [Halioglobus sp.]|nr:sulfotransferase [Halioglobus sp.]
MDSADRLEQKAREATGLSDFGEPSYREGLTLLLDSAARDANFNETGRAAFEAQLTGLLGNRLQVEHWYQRHPEIDEQEIVAPLIGLGLPRTGSTALSCL